MSECKYYKDHGKSYYIVKCPFCGQYNTCYAWSISANGKRCEDCKSLITLKAGEFTVTKKDTKSKKTLKSEM